MELWERLLAASSDGTTRKDMLKLKKIKLIAETTSPWPSTDLIGSGLS
jgi:hypothetical protein